MSEERDSEIFATLIDSKFYSDSYRTYIFMNIKNKGVFDFEEKYYTIWEVLEKDIDLENLWEGDSYTHEIFGDENLINILIDNKINLIILNGDEISRIAPYHVKKLRRILKIIKKRYRKISKY